MPLPERLTKTQIKEKLLSFEDMSHLHFRGSIRIKTETLDSLLTEAYNQGTLCQHSSHGNRVGHFEEWNK